MAQQLPTWEYYPHFAARPQPDYDSNSILSARLEWHQKMLGVSHFIGHGLLHVSLLAGCLVWFLVTIFALPRPHMPQTASMSKRSTILEIIAQVLRAGAFTYSLIELSSGVEIRNTPETVLLGVCFLAGLVRIAVVPATSSLRAQIYHQVNMLLVGGILLGIAQDLAPIFILDSPYRPSGTAVGKLVCITSALAVAFVSPRQWTPPPMAFNLVHREPEAGPSPEETCSWLSYFMSYGWLTHIILNGYRRSLKNSDLLPLPYYDEPLIWLERILAARKKWMTTFRTMIALLHYDISRQMFFASLTSFSEFVAPVAMYQLLHYLESPAKAIVNPAIWVLLLFVGPMSRSIFFQQYIFGSTRLVVRTRLSMVQELYSKALQSISFEATESEESKVASAVSSTKPKVAKNGHISNLMSFDVDALYSSRDVIYVMMSTPIGLSMAVLILYRLLGWASLVGVSVLISSFPWAAFLSRRMAQYQKSVLLATDKRIALISEYLSSIRTIKYFAWETSMSHNIKVARDEEQKYIWKRNICSALIMVSGDSAPIFSLFVMLMVYTLGTGQPLSAAVAFTSMSVVEALRTQFVWVSNATRFWGQAAISCQRIDNYFNTAVERKRHDVGPPSFKNATFRRTPVAEFRLHNLNVDFLENKLNIIMGSSASGKSSLLLSLLGETVLESGEATCPKDVAYASQSAWLMNDTIRNNIVFYQDFEQSRFDTVVRACGLDRDLENLEDGAMTQIGDNGSTLSGGQRQRIALARAFYSKSELLLLDDIFSALDVETASLVWKRAFCGELVYNRTVILVTQQQWLAEEADLAIIMDGGEIVSIEYHDHSGRSSIPKAPHISSPPSPTLKAMTVAEPIAMEDAAKVADSPETAGQGRNERTLFYQYMYMFGGHSFAIFALVIAFATQLAFFSIALWLSIWVNQYPKAEAVNVAFYLGVYAVILVGYTLLSGTKDLVFRYGAWRAAFKMHDSLVQSILSVPISWFDVNPAGRVINRFSQDMVSVDLKLVDLLRISADSALRLFLRIVGIGSIMPIFALPAAFACSFGFAVGELYTKAQLPVKKMFSASNSPIFSQFQDTMSGLAVIRARGMEDVFSDVLAKRLREWARAAETLFNLNRWVSVRADASSACVAFMAGILALWKADTVSAGLVGFSLTNAIGISSTILGLVRNANELEIELNCFHRVREYADLTPEQPADFEGTRMLGSSRSEEPVIEFRNVTARYSDDGPDVLKNVSFKIKAGERIAIVGRTGSGKSTTALCLLRFVQISSGSIFIDGIDISSVSLPELRREVTIIPQEPVLFSGTVESNLDPSGTINEAVIAHSLQACSSIAAINSPHKTVVNSTTDLVDVDVASSSNASTNSTYVSPSPTSRITLTTQIVPRGDNLSQGERQILGVARAIARQSKIVLMDEATASVDYASDAAIQEVLRQEFKGRTVLCIAHRLRTIVDYDRILVFGGGEVLEMGPPKELYAKKGFFWTMVGQSSEAKELVGMLEN